MLVSASHILAMSKRLLAASGDLPSGQYITHTSKFFLKRHKLEAWRAHACSCPLSTLTTGPQPLTDGLVLALGRADDTLPPAVQQLHVQLRGNAACSPLLGLTALTGLTLLNPIGPSTEQYKAVASSLTDLRELELLFT
jgi:hypothetical protein